MSRPAKSAGLRTGHMTKGEIETRTIAENSIKGGTENLVPPDYLTAGQADIFVYILNALKESAILSNLDVFILANCAISIDRIRQYDEMISTDATMLCDKDIIGNRNKTVTEFLRYCNELCLSPQARAKIGTAALQKKQSAVDPISAIINKGGGVG